MKIFRMEDGKQGLSELYSRVGKNFSKTSAYARKQMYQLRHQKYHFDTYPGIQ